MYIYIFIFYYTFKTYHNFDTNKIPKLLKLNIFTVNHLRVLFCFLHLRKKNI